MSSTSKWEVIVPAEGVSPTLFSRRQVRSLYDNSFARNTHPILEDRIVEASLQFRSVQSVHDDRGYRLATVRQADDRVELGIGPASYIDYLAFRSRPEIFDMIPISRDQMPDFLPNLIGNVGILITRDRKTFSVLRSKSVSTYRGFLDFPGGHPEPARVEAAMQKHIEGQTSSEDLIGEELFDAVVREVVEDLGVDESALDDPLLLGILLNVEDVMKPDMVFVITTTLSSKDVQDAFFYCDPKPHEVEKIVSFDPKMPAGELSLYSLTPIMDGAISMLRTLGREGLDDTLQSRV